MATKKHTGLLGNINLSDCVSVNIQRVIDNAGNRLQDGPAFSPLSARRRPVGLFSTAWGIYHALTAIGIAGQVWIDKVAGPVRDADHDGHPPHGCVAGGARLHLPDRSKRAMEENRSFSVDLHDVPMSSPQAPKFELGAKKPFDEAPPFSAQNAGSNASAIGVSRSCARLVAASTTGRCATRSSSLHASGRQGVTLPGSR